MSVPCIVCGSPTTPFIEKIWDDRYGHPGEFGIDRCTQCGQMVTLPPLTEADLPALYSGYYPRTGIDFAALEREAALVRRPLAAFRRWLAGTDNQGHYTARPGNRVLDIGCGSCLSLLEMRHLGVEPFGVETDPNVATIAERYGLRVHIGSVHDNPFPDTTFDLIVLNQVIEHVPDPAALLELVGSRLTPGGEVVLAFPNVGSLVRRLSGRRWINWHVPYHQHHFTRRSFARLAEKCGFTVVHGRTATPNLWTMLQISASRGSPDRGDASQTWGAVDSVTPRWRRRLVGGVRRAAMLVVAPVVTVTNRIIDALGFGDSIVVRVRKKS